MTQTYAVYGITQRHYALQTTAPKPICSDVTSSASRVYR